MRDQLKLVATKVRETIELVDKNEFPPECQIYHSFPQGACGDTSILLGKLLLDKFDVDCNYVCGSSLLEGHEQETHAWLEYKGWIIDITPDQFEGISDKVIVEKHHELYDKYETDPSKRISECFPDEMNSSYTLIQNKIYQ